MIFDNYVVDYIVKDTYKYYGYVKSKLETTEAGITPKSKLHNWTDKCK